MLLGALIGCGTIQAQEPEKENSQLDRTVVVENIYNPDIMNAQKINIMPTLEEPQTDKKQIEYATSSKPSNRFGFEPMAQLDASPRQAHIPNGYLRLGYGMNGNADGRLNYRFNLGKRDVLNAHLTFRGMEGSIDLPETIGLTEEWNARTYRTQGGIDWTHRFNPFTLFVEANAENQVFNYMNFYQWADNTHQHNILGSFKASIKSNDHDADIRYQAGTGVLYANQKYAFGYYDENNNEPYTELLIRSHAQVTGDINERTSVSIAAQMDNLIANPGGAYNKTSHTSLQLNPYLSSEGKRWKARIGAHIDPVFTEGNTDFSLAPDLYGEYTFTQRYTLYLQADGGRELNDFRTINSFDPYAEFPVYRNGVQGEGYYLPQHTFHQLDGRLGFKATPINELALHLYGGYRMTEEQLFSTYLTDYSHERLCYLMQDDANVLYAGASVQYTWKDILTTRAEVEWNKWESDLMDTYTTLTPELTLRWTANIHAIDRMNIGLSYQYEQRCKDFSDNRPKAVNNLGLTASYRLFDWLTLYAQGDNLLNQKYYQHIMQPGQGLHFLGGAVLEF